MQNVSAIDFICNYCINFNIDITPLERVPKLPPNWTDSFRIHSVRVLIFNTSLTGNIYRFKYTKIESNFSRERKIWCLTKDPRLRGIKKKLEIISPIRQPEGTYRFTQLFTRSHHSELASAISDARNMSSIYSISNISCFSRYLDARILYHPTTVFFSTWKILLSFSVHSITFYSLYQHHFSQFFDQF